MTDDRPDDAWEAAVGDDEEHLVQRKRLEQIFDARKTVKKAMHAVVEEEIKGAISESEARTVIRKAVESYVLETKWLIIQHDQRTDGKDYWTDRELGEQVLPNGDYVAFNGLQSFATAPEKLEYETTRTSAGSLQGKQTTVDKRAVQISREISMAAFDCVNEFLAEIDLDLTIRNHETTGKWTVEDAKQHGKAIEDELLDNGSGEEVES